MAKAITNFTKIWNKGSYILYCIVFFLVIFFLSLVRQSETGIFQKCKIRMLPYLPHYNSAFFYVNQLQDAAQGIYNVFFS